MHTRSKQAITPLRSESHRTGMQLLMLLLTQDNAPLSDDVHSVLSLALLRLLLPCAALQRTAQPSAPVGVSLLLTAAAPLATASSFPFARHRAKARLSVCSFVYAVIIAASA